MARFNPDVPTKNEPNYLGYSKEPDRLQPNQAYEKLFSGLGSLFHEGVAGSDELIKQKLETDAYKSIDEVQDKFGANTTGDEAKKLGTLGSKAARQANQSNLGTSIQAAGESSEGALPYSKEDPVYKRDTQLLPDQSASQPLPTQITSGINQIDKAKQALESGEFTSTYYHQQLQSVVQGLRSRYPGYRGEIDKKVAEITGVRPANSLISDVIRDLNATQAGQNSLVNSRMNKINSWHQYLGADGVKQAYSAITDDNKWMKIEQYVAEQQKLNYQVTTAKSQLELKKATGQAKAEDAETHFMDAATAQVTGIVNAAQFGAGGMDFQGFQKAINAQIASGRTDPNFVQAANGLLAQLEGVTRQKLNTIAKDYSSTIKDPTKMNNLINQAMAPITTLQGLISKEQFALAGASANMNKMVGDNIQYELLKTETNQKIAGMDKVFGRLGGTYLNLMISENPAFLKEGFESLKLMRTMKYGYGEGSMNDVLTDHKAAFAKSKTPPREYIMSEITDIKKMITDKNAPLQIKQNAAKVLMDSGTQNFLNSFNDKERFNVWGMLSTPEVAKSMKEMGPEQFNKYGAWMDETFQRLFKSYVDDTTQHNIDIKSLGGQVSWNEDKGQFDFRRPKPTWGKYGTMMPTPDVDLAEQNINRLNSGIRAIGNVYRENGQEVGPAVYQRLQGMGLNMNKTPVPTLMESIKNYFSGGKEGKDSKGFDLFNQQQPSKFAPEDKLSNTQIPKQEMQAQAKQQNQLPEQITRGLHPNFKERLERMMNDAPGKVNIYSGYRTVERQKQLFDAEVKKRGSVEEARKYVAPPGRSQHNFGAAADLRFQSPEVQRWVHENASKYGLNFRMSHEKWHIEPQRADGGRVGYAEGGYTPSNTRMSTGNSSDDGAIDGIVNQHGPKINPKNWETMLKENASDNIDDQRQDGDEEQVTRDYGLYLLKKKMNEEPVKEATKITVNKSPKKETKKDKKNVK